MPEVLNGKNDQDYVQIDRMRKVLSGKKWSGHV